MVASPVEEHQKTETKHVLVVDDENGRRAILLEAVTYSVGRDPTNSIMLNSKAVSRQQALLLRIPMPGGGGHIFRIIDGNTEGKRSTNGMTINDQRCYSRDLDDGDIIIFAGKVKAQYCVRDMSQEEWEQYTDSVAYRSLKLSPVDPLKTGVYTPPPEDE